LRPRHFHPQGARCCWCAIEETTGARLFDDGQTSTVDADAMTAEQLWQAIEGVQAPPLRAEIPPFAAEFQDALDGKDFRGKLAASLAGAALPIVLGVFLSAFISRLPMGISERAWMMGFLVTGTIIAGIFATWNRFSRMRRALRAEWKRAIGKWRNTTSASPYYQVRVQLEDRRSFLVRIGEQRLQEIDKVRKRFEAPQRAAFLDKFEIESTVFMTVSRSQVVALLVHGIRSAGDLERRDNQLHKFVQSTSLRELRAWTRQCAAQFNFDAREPAYWAEAEKIEERYRLQRQSILDELRRGPEKLEAVRQAVDDTRAQADDTLREAHATLRRTRDAQKQ